METLPSCRVFNHTQDAIVFRIRQLICTACFHFNIKYLIEVYRKCVASTEKDPTIQSQHPMRETTFSNSLT